MSRPVLVTGATGFIGGRLVERLVAGGHAVRALVRCPDRMRPELRERVDLVVGSLEHPGALRRAMAGTATVFHLAGLATAWSRCKSDYLEVNVEGVRRVLVAAQLEAVSRVVHVSTVLTRFHHSTRPTPYVASKRAGEGLVERYARAGGDAVIVQPCRVYGPGPLNDANGATRLIHSYVHGRVPVRLRDGGVRAHWVHVDDVVDGLLLADRCGRRGEAYVLGGESSSVEELLDLVGDLTGTRRRVVAVPATVALLAAGLMELGGVLGAPVPITRGWVRSFLEDQTVDVRPTMDALGFAPRTLRDGLAQTLVWLEREHGGA